LLAHTLVPQVEVDPTAADAEAKAASTISSLGAITTGTCDAVAGTNNGSHSVWFVPLSDRSERLVLGSSAASLRAAWSDALLSNWGIHIAARIEPTEQVSSHLPAPPTIGDSDTLRPPPLVASDELTAMLRHASTPKVLKLRAALLSYSKTRLNETLIRETVDESGTPTVRWWQVAGRDRLPAFRLRPIAPTRLNRRGPQR
jgi:hypothetical protein